MKSYTIEDVMKAKKLQEATAVQKFGENEVVEPVDKNGDSITDTLDHCAEGAREFYALLGSQLKRGIKTATVDDTNAFNPLFIGPTGCGKTSIIKTWARDNGLEVVTINLKGDSLDFLGVKDVDKNYRLYNGDDDKEGKIVSRTSTIPTRAFDPFLRGNMKILFLDEINTAPRGILQPLFDLISFHCIQNGDDMMYLPKLLFTVGAMNPPEYGGGREQIDTALSYRMYPHYVGYDVPGFKKFILARLEGQLKAATAELKDLKDDPDSEDYKLWLRIYQKVAGKIDLVNVILNDTSKFKFTDAESIESVIDPNKERGMVPRTFTAALDHCDGTAVDLLRYTKKLCGEEAYTLIDKLLKNYSDKKHKANEIWGKDYTPHEEEISAEQQVIDNASDEEKKAAEIDTNWLNVFDKTQL